jgi:hypothetical protein
MPRASALSKALPFAFRHFHTSLAWSLSSLEIGCGVGGPVAFARYRVKFSNDFDAGSVRRDELVAHLETS